MVSSSRCSVARWRGGEGDNLHIVTIYSVIKQRQPAACAVQWCSVQRRPGAAALQWSRHLLQPRLLPGCSCCSNQAGRCCQAEHCSSCSRGGGYKQPSTLVCTAYLHDSLCKTSTVPGPRTSKYKYHQYFPNESFICEPVTVS